MIVCLLAISCLWSEPVNAEISQEIPIGGVHLSGIIDAGGVLPVDRTEGDGWQVEQYFFNAADDVTGTRGLFPEVGCPFTVSWDGVPLSLPVCGSFPLSRLPLTSREERGLSRIVRPDLILGPSPGGALEVTVLQPLLSERRLTATVGDEAGDAMMLDFLDPGSSVPNRGSLLGLEAEIPGRSRLLGDWWLLGHYRKNDWMAYRRHGVRTTIAPVEEGRENVGTIEKAILAGGLHKSVGSGTVFVHGTIQQFPALWVRDAGTRRTTKWKGTTGLAAAHVGNKWGATTRNRISARLGIEGTNLQNVHNDPGMDIGFSDHIETIVIDGSQELSEHISLRERVYGRLEHVKVSAEGAKPSHGYEGPPGLAAGGAFLGMDYSWSKKTKVRLATRLDKREREPGIPSVSLQFVHGLSRGPGAWVEFLHSGHLPDLFHEYGWCRARHPDLGTEGVHFQGGPLDPETFNLVEAGFQLAGTQTRARLVIFSETIHDRIVAADETWSLIGGDLEWVRSGHWTNGGCATSTGAEITGSVFGTWRGCWPGIRGFLFVRDVDWHPSKEGVGTPPLGGRAGGGIIANVGLPREVDVWAEARSVASPRFSSYGSWTEETDSDRVRWDAGIRAGLSPSWNLEISAFDILDDGHIEVPGGNAVGFRVVGDLRWRP